MNPARSIFLRILPYSRTGRRRVKFCIAGVILLFLFLFQWRRGSRGSPTKPYERLSRPKSEVQWGDLVPIHPIGSSRPLPSTQFKKLPRLQHVFDREGFFAKRIRKQRREVIKKTFRKSWQGYRKYAWLQDELHPLSGTSGNPFGGWAATLIDSLDTLWIMGMRTEFEEAVDELTKIDMSRSSNQEINVFESTIRILGGLLAAYDVSDGRYQVLLSRAQDFADMLLCAFDTPNRMPVSWWRWKNYLNGEPQVANNGAPLADLASLSMEFTHLSQLTGDNKFYDAISRITDELDKSQADTILPGMWPMAIDASGLGFWDDRFSLGALADSAYECLPKQYILLGGVSEASQYKWMYEHAFEAMNENLFFKPMTPNNSDILLPGNLQADHENYNFILDPEAQHLTCFAGGMVELGSKLFGHSEQFDVGRKLVDGCIWLYDIMPSKIMPERSHMMPCVDRNSCVWDEKRWQAGKKTSFRGITEIGDPRYMLRPEAIESIFVHYRLTGEQRYQEIAWKMFEAIEKHTSVEIANAALSDVTKIPPPKSDHMESFWLGETLKYFYLIFSEPDVVSLDNFVLNTEAHPFKIPKQP